MRYHFLLHARLHVVCHQFLLYSSLSDLFPPLIHLFPSTYQSLPLSLFLPWPPPITFSLPSASLSPLSLCSLVAVMYRLLGLHFSSSSSSFSSTSPQRVSSSDDGDSVGASGGTTERRTGWDPGGESLRKTGCQGRTKDSEIDHTRLKQSQRKHFLVTIYAHVSQLLCCKSMKCFCSLCNQHCYTSLTSCNDGARYSLIREVI